MPTSERDSRQGTSRRQFQARACNTLDFKAVARSATHRHRALGPAP